MDRIKINTLIMIVIFVVMSFVLVKAANKTEMKLNQEEIEAAKPKSCRDKGVSSYEGSDGKMIYCADGKVVYGDPSKTKTNK